MLPSTATPAHAHDVIGVGGFYGGLLHPLLVPAHIMALVALGLLMGQQAPDRHALLALLTAALVAGIVVIVLAFAADNPDYAVLAVAALAGIAVAAGRPLPVALTGPIVLVAGVAVALDSVPQEISMPATFLALVATAIMAVIVTALAAAIATRLARGWPAIAVRVAGSWIAASAILVLALRLTR